MLITHLCCLVLEVAQENSAYLKSQFGQVSAIQQGSLDSVFRVLVVHGFTRFNSRDSSLADFPTDTLRTHMHNKHAECQFRANFILITSLMINHCVIEPIMHRVCVWWNIH